MRHAFLVSAFVVAMNIFAGCASDRPAGEPQYEEGAIIHEVTEADKARVASKAPLTGAGAALYVNGLGCPLCASNIDRQLTRVDGVSTINTDLSHGIVTVVFEEDEKPSAYDLGEAVADAGFTLVKIELR
jgi:copper chaperone CopZ